MNKASASPLPAKTPFTVTVMNQDAGIDHNFAIYDGIDQAKQFFATPKLPGVARNTSLDPGRPPGQYYFQCNVHGPSMSGVFIVKRGREDDGG